MGICYIIGAGQCSGLDIKKEKKDLIICADGGLSYAEKYKIVPDIIIGDFDSYGNIPAKGNVIVLPAEKDFTDTHFAVKTAIEKGYRRFRLYGMLGGRIDHTLANIQLLKYIVESNGEAVLVGDEFDVTMIKNSKLKLSGDKGNYVSVFSCIEKSCGVNIKGLKYEVTDFVLTDSNPMGVSNEFSDEEAVVEVADGLLLITIQK